MNAGALTHSARDVLEQGLALLASTDDETYMTLVPAPHSASIGQHYRHVLDHFICLADGIATGVIDYDARGRNRELETKREAAAESTLNLLELFSSLTERDLSTEYKVLYSVGYTDEEAQTINTVLAREVAFCVSHAIHHFAIIKLVCSHFEMMLPEEFGVAPSTLKYRAAQAGA